MITFSVSDVVPAVDLLPRVEAREAIEALSGMPIEAWARPRGDLVRAWATSPPPPKLVSDGLGQIWHPFHPLVAAVHFAFDQHRPIVLTPDAIWLCLIQGVALHARSKVVPSTIFERETIAIRRDAFVKGSLDNNWPGAIAELAQAVAERTGDLHEKIAADFSTTDSTNRAVCDLTLLAAARPFFTYRVSTLCGIPSITLEGTVEDWRSIRRRAANLATLDLEWWIDPLLPILDEFVTAAEGSAQIDNWRSFYKLDEESGGPYVTGWINVLLPYVFNRAGALVRNLWITRWRTGGGVAVADLPSGLCRVPFFWRHPQHEYRMDFLGGFVGVCQDPATRSLRPELGWAVREYRKMDDGRICRTTCREP